MNIVESQQNGITELKLEGRLDSNTSRALEQKTTALFGADKTRVLFDLAALDYISSAGLRVFLQAAKAARRTGGTLVLAGMNENVREVFDISGFSQLFTLAPSIDEARKAHAG